MLLIFVLVTILTTVHSTPTINYCEKIQENTLAFEIEYSLSVWIPKENIQACYVAIKNGYTKTAVSKNSDKIGFSMQAARELCEKFGLTLPSIRSELENQAVAKFGYAPLGIKTAKQGEKTPPEKPEEESNDYLHQVAEWDDGTKSKYAPKSWYGLSPNFTFITPTGNWYSIEEDSVAPRNWTIICKQTTVAAKKGAGVGGSTESSSGNMAFASLITFGGIVIMVAVKCLTQY